MAFDTPGLQAAIAVLQARPDGLPAPEKRILQDASVIGAVSRDRALHARRAAWLRECNGRAPGSHKGETLGLTGDHYKKAGDITHAVDFRARAAVRARELGATDGAAARAARTGTTAAERELDALPQAKRRLDGGLLRLRAVGESTIGSSALADLSQLALMQGNDVGALRHAQAAVTLARSTRSSNCAIKALQRLADAELALGQASSALRTDASAWWEGDDKRSPERFEAAAGMARSAWALADPAAALADAEPLLRHWQDGGSFEGAMRPRRVMAPWHDLLQAAGHPQAAQALAQARSALMQAAEPLKDPVPRQGFLQRLPEHRHLPQAIDGC